MSQFKQKPARKKKKRRPDRESPVSFRSAKSRSFSPFKSIARAIRRSRDKKTEIETAKSGFSFPVPSLATLAVIAGTVVISLAVLNWEDFPINKPESYILQPAADSEAARRAMIYAVTGETAVLSAGFPAENELITASVTGNELDGSGHDDLIVFEWQQYRVRRGDSVSVIAQRFGVSVGAIIASNEIRNARTLQEGAMLRIPNVDGIPYQVKNGDSLSRIAASFNVPLEVILDINDIRSDNIKPGETLFIPGARMNDMDLRLSLGELFTYPVSGRFVTSSYGMRKDPISGVLTFHTGIDLRADTGTAVTAALDGVVSAVAESWLYGKHIIITHDNGYKTLYAHLNSYSVKQGERVARGRKIGESGNTGYSTGPHLHFSIYDKNNKLVNPLELLR